jgi:hypothetical protein
MDAFNVDTTNNVDMDVSNIDNSYVDHSINDHSNVDVSNIDVSNIDDSNVDVSNVDDDVDTTIIINTVKPDTTAVTITNLDVPLMGSSQTSGGLLHGHVHGNVPRHADFVNTLDLDLPVVKGEVSLYLTEQYPRNVNFETLKGESDLVVIVKAVGGMAAILGIVAHKCPIIQDQDYHIYYRRLMKWIALGRLYQAIQDDDECEWEMSKENIPELHLLFISLNCKYIFGNLIQLFRVLTKGLLPAMLLDYPMFLQSLFPELPLLLHLSQFLDVKSIL